MLPSLQPPPSEPYLVSTSLDRHYQQQLSARGLANPGRCSAPSCVSNSRQLPLAKGCSHLAHRGL